MEQQNSKLKFKLVIQSFVPLFLLILIKYFDYHAITSVTLFIKKLLHGDFGIFLRMWTNQYFGVLWVSLFSILWIISGMISLWQFKDVHFSGFVDAGDKVATENWVATQITGATGTFTSQDGKTITVTNGLISLIV